MAKNKELETKVIIGAEMKKNVKRVIRSVQQSFYSLNASIDKVTKGIALATTAMATAAAAASVVATRELYKMGEGWEKANDTIRIGTGATGKQLEALNESMQRVYAQLPAGKDEVSSTIADINTLTGAEGKALEDYASAALKASKMLGSDVKSIYMEASKAFNAFNIPAEEMAGKLDYLWKVSQSTGVGIDKLAQGAVAGQATFRQLGFSFEQSTALLGQLDKAGVSSSAALAAMKKGVVELAKAGAKDFSKAFTALSQKIKNARTETEAINIASKVFGARGGGEIAKALRDGRMSADAFTKSLELSGESIDAAYADTANFAEKMTPIKHKVELALKPLADTVFKQINELVPVVGGVVEKYLPTIQAHATELSVKVKELSDRFMKWIQEVDFEKLASDIKQAFAEGLDKAREWLPILETWGKRIAIVIAAVKGLSVAVSTYNLLSGAIAMCVTVLKPFFLLISLSCQGIWKLVVAMKAVLFWHGWVKVATALQAGWNTALFTADLAMTKVSKGMKALAAWHGWVKVATALQWAWNIALNANPIGLIVLAVAALIGIGWLLYNNWDDICAGMQAAWDWLCEQLSALWEPCKKGLAIAWEWLGTKWDEITGGIRDTWDKICGKVTEKWEGVKTSLSNAWEGIKTACAKAIDWMMEKIQPFLDAWDAVKNGVSGVLAKVGLGGGDEPEKKARGGFTHGIAICGEAGTEAVISFDPAYRAENQRYVATAASLLGGSATFTPRAESAPAQSSFSFGDIHISPVFNGSGNVDRRSILRAIEDCIPDVLDKLQEEANARKLHRYA